MSVPIHPDWVLLEQGLGSRPVLLSSIEEIREASNHIADNLNPTYPVLNPKPRIVEERATDSGLRVRVFTPEVATQDPLPVGVYGGWASGSIEAEEATCIHVAVQVPSIIIAVAYRLAPEFKAPAAHNDAVDALIWAWKNVSGLGGDQTRLFTIGGSAGGNLAISVVLKTLDQEINVTGIVAIVPVTVHPDGVPSKHRSAYKS
ncbi:hypothetical protein N7481_001495 [Penicillium waksmanii]|uniref:uncharacterized protein n=1 Tax=Penicillium waksmanii TaxID=69791 RepID=UPI0025474B51|nr:uncharacterized protein N7481_001495 [Penicillium waksmanii]KAJ6001086.1 hypothetical protein N7481_001495 [Penicillium waksmanii]